MFSHHPMFYDGWGVDRRGWADKSQAALRREQTAKEEFDKLRQTVESRSDLTPGAALKFELLKPSCHLTEACNKTFRQHVHSAPGWSAKRRAATEEEKKEHKVTRKGKSFFTSVTYLVPFDLHEKAEKENETPHEAAKKNKRPHDEWNEEGASGSGLCGSGGATHHSKKVKNY